MRNRGVRMTSAVALLLALVLAVGCGAVERPIASDEKGAVVEEVQESSEAEEDEELSEEDAWAAREYERALSQKGLVNGFIGEQFYDELVEDGEDALAAVQSVLKRIGGDETTVLELREIRPTETGPTYYCFRQQAGEVVVDGASVKLVVGKDHKVDGVVSAILPDVQIEELGSWEITDKVAEQVVVAECADRGFEDARIVADATEQVLIAMGDEGTSAQRYAWVVYTNNYYDDLDAAYLAHYVSATGDYLYSIPVNELSNADARAGDKAAFAFDQMQASTWSGTVTKHDGTQMDVEVPVLIDPESGDVVLGDAKRKILCADYADFAFNDTLSPRVEGKDGFDSGEVLIYKTFIQVWDYYNDIGWNGPDDNGTPTLLMMDMVDEQGEVVQNAFYSDRQWGFQTFAFNRLDPDGECYDIIAHEFTHCVTGASMMSSVYLNDSGAINEGMSDIMGNLIEMAVAYDEDGAWVFGENGLEIMRSMKDPHAYRQPEYTWDMYYGPAANEATWANDCGGAHINASLLGSISYRLGQAGMSNEEQFYYWMNVILAMTPSTDYPQMAKLLPWCMEEAGFTQYVDAVKQAVEEARLAQTEAPENPSGEGSYLKLAVPKDADVSPSNMRLTIDSVGDEAGGRSFITWVGADADSFVANVPAGNYTLAMSYWDGENVTADYVLTDDGWEQRVNEESGENARTVSIEAGTVVELPVEGLAA